MDPHGLPRMMRAAVYDETGPADVLRPAEVPVPAPVLSEVLVRVHAAGVNPIDAKTRAGSGVSAAVTGSPVVPGFDVSGVVVASPYESHPFPAGTEVFGVTAFPRVDGSYAEYAVLSSLSLARKPATLSHEEAAAVPLAALTAWGLVVDTARARPGQRILIHAGAGGVGHLAVQLAAHVGAEVVATASGSHVPWLTELGAAEAIDHRAMAFEDAVDTVDVVIDLVGNVHDDTGTRSLSVLRRDGLYICVPSGGWPDYALAAEAAGVRATSYKLIPDGRSLARIAELIDDGALRVHLDRVFPLAEAAAAHRELERGHTRGKIVLRVTE